MFWEEVPQSELPGVRKENGVKETACIAPSAACTKNGGAHTGTAICHAGFHLPSSIS